MGVWLPSAPEQDAPQQLARCSVTKDANEATDATAANFVIEKAF